jgi:hypothetical protein
MKRSQIQYRFASRINQISAFASWNLSVTALHLTLTRMLPIIAQKNRGFPDGWMASLRKSTATTTPRQKDSACGEGASHGARNDAIHQRASFTQNMHRKSVKPGRDALRFRG